MHYDVEQDVVLFESIRNDLSNRLSDLRGISDEELYEMIDELIASKEKEYDEDEDYYGSFDDEDGEFDSLDINFSGDENDEE